MTLRPLHDRVLVRRSESEEMIGSLHLPGSARSKSQRGTVIAVGPGDRTDKGLRLPTVVKVGDLVAFSKYAGEDVTERKYLLQLDGVEHVIMREDEILAVIEETRPEAA